MKWATSLTEKSDAKLILNRPYLSAIQGSPQYTAILSNWDFQTKLPDFLFKFAPPDGAKEINVAEIKSKDEAHKNGGK